MTTNITNHARAFDLPGWPCPPRVRDIASTKNSWGLVHVGTFSGIAQDEIGYLWADGDFVPRFALADNVIADPGAVLCWTESGLGVWVHPKSLASLPSMSRLDMGTERWVPIATVLRELPDFVRSE